MTTTQYEIALTRTFDAPPERVFDAWTNPKKLAKWFGPDGFTTTTHQMDVRPGGVWLHTMRGPDGREYPNRIVYVEVDRPRRLVYDHVSGPRFRATIAFERSGRGTHVSFRMVFPDKDAYRVATEEHGAREGARQTIARLAAAVETEDKDMTTKTTTQPPILKLERTFHATPERLWSYWTDPKKYAKWFNPAPIDLVIHEYDARVGGRVRFDMPQPDGSPNPQEGVFHSLTPYKEIVSGAPDKSFLITVRFEPVDAKRTRMSVEVVGVPPEYHAMATVGWNQGFDKLEREIAAGDGDSGFTIERTFAAPPERVWRMWTTPEGIAKWWVVAAKEMGYAMTVERMDVRVGGGFAFRMTGNGHDIVNGGTYRVVEPARRLAWTWHYDIFLAPDEKPYDVPIEVTLAPTGAGGTRMTFKQGPLARREHTEGSRQGVRANFEKLALALEDA